MSPSCSRATAIRHAHPPVVEEVETLRDLCQGKPGEGEQPGRALTTLPSTKRVDHDSGHASKSARGRSDCGSLGNDPHGNAVHTPVSNMLPLLCPNDIVWGGWDINSTDLGDAMKRSKVLDCTHT